MVKSIYVSDLDGTLLDESAKLSEEAQQMINGLISKGTLFTVASARSYATMKSILSEIKFNLPIIEFNGGYITDFETGNHLVINSIKEDKTKQIYSLIKENNLESLVSTFDGEKDELFYFESTSSGMSQFINDREKSIDFKLGRFNDFTEISSHKIMCFTVIDEKKKILDLRDKLNERFKDSVIVEAWEDMYYKPWYWLSIHSIESTKANAIKRLCEMNDISHDKLVTFGDNINDIEMFKISHRGYAVENAVEDLKNIAYEVIGSNSVINKIIELEKE